MPRNCLFATYTIYFVSACVVMNVVCASTNATTSPSVESEDFELINSTLADVTTKAPDLRFEILKKYGNLVYQEATNSFMYLLKSRGEPTLGLGEKAVSGDYCLPAFFSCNTQNTIMYCIQGRCTCPTDWNLVPGNLPLNTVWYPAARKCIALLGSGCHVTVVPNSGTVECQPGIQCVPDPAHPTVGICSNCSSRKSLLPASIVMLWILLKCIS